MLLLPPELQHIIFSLLEAEELRVLVQVSQAFRQLSLSHLFSRYNIPMSQILSGEVCIREEASFLVSTIYHIHPIEKLTILPTKLIRRHVSLSALPKILGAIQQIPDVLISGPTHATISSGVPEVIATLSRGGKNSVVLVGQGYMHVSLPRRSPPIRWTKFPKYPLKSLAPRHVGTAIILFIPLLVIFMLIIAVNLYRILRWLHRCFWSPLDQTARIAADLGRMHGDVMRIQTVSGTNVGQFTLVTFSGSQMESLYIHFGPNLLPAQSAALLAALDLRQKLVTLRVRKDAALNLPALLSFIRRHQSLKRLILPPGAIDAASMMQEPEVHTYPGRVTFLSSPAAYIPYILAIERRVQTLVITPVSNMDALSRALDAIAAVPPDITRFRELTLEITRPSPISTMLPWRRAHAVEAGSPIHGVVRLALIAEFKYRASDVQDLIRWLARFPQLRLLDFYRHSVPVQAQAALAEAIAQARGGTGATEWGGVQFHA
ncbi:hypothetical protein B0H19DRAFT_1269005 [Mycena capillaripes]|nr:hypothetical protein B0H19DRAFT_1269005 [Mycena capillaripes]